MDLSRRHWKKNGNLESREETTRRLMAMAMDDNNNQAPLKNLLEIFVALLLRNVSMGIRGGGMQDVHG